MKKVKIGVFGGYRGASMIKYARIAENAELVAICDKLPEVIERQKKICGDQVTYYDNFEDFIKHDMDAVILANYANEHAPFAIRCMKADKAEREKWRNDTTCCDKRVAGDMYVPAFSKGEPDIPDEVYENMRRKWQEK